ncbi:MAG: DUF4398 domain-containing protein [Geminicoccaceae bacterium]|nr:DUF4398 domain-containing protein [Geminicoccaceae bacterium]
MKTRSIILGGSTLLLAACASTPPPEGELRAAEVAVGEAVEADAGVHAPALLQQARDKLARAKQAVDDERPVEARRLAEQAAVDAQLAEARARAEVATGHLREVRQGVDGLRDAPIDPVVLPQGG